MLPALVLASGRCYVDQDGKKGDGSKSKPYQSISQALAKDCSHISVAKGKYSGDIVIGKKVSVRGKGKNQVTIAGTVTMKDGASLSGVTVTGSGGVVAAKNAAIEVKDVKISGALVGIKTVAGKGGVTAKNVRITDGRKGFYLQSGNHVKISNCNISGNKEEGIDIRSDVSGTISNNSIIGNGESGIEVILGKADLVISGNTIKRNKSSGIAAQYYRKTGKSGAVKVKNNIISANRQYGINCKAPSGGSPPKGFWGASLDMFSNKLMGNGDGNFAQLCGLSELVQQGASMSKEEQAAALKKAEEEERKRQEEEKKKDQEALIARERKENEKAEETLRRVEEERRRKEEQQRKLRVQIEQQLEQLNGVKQADQKDNAQLNERSKFTLFLIGADQNLAAQIIGREENFQNQLAAIQKEIFQVSNESKRSDFQSQLNELKNLREAILKNAQAKKEKWSLFGWLLKKK